jgi:hypothetical protein
MRGWQSVKNLLSFFLKDKSDLIMAASGCHLLSEGVMQEKIAAEGVIRTACAKDFPRMLVLNSQSVHFLSPLSSRSGFMTARNTFHCGKDAAPDAQLVLIFLTKEG